MLLLHKILVEDKIPGTNKDMFTVVCEGMDMVEAAFSVTPDRENWAEMIGQNPTGFTIYCLMCNLKASMECVQRFLAITC